MVDTSPDSRYFRLEALADGVFAALVVGGSGAQGNAGIIDLGDATVVFDTMLTPAAGRDLCAAAERLTGRPVTWVVNSHRHADHLFGNQAFPAAAPVIATAATRDWLVAHGPAMLADYTGERLPRTIVHTEAELEQEQDPAKRRSLQEAVGDLRAVAAAAGELTLRPPTVSFTNRLALHGARRTAELITLGGGHTESDAFLHLPDEGIVFAGDLCAVRFHPWLGEGDPEQLLRSLERIEALAPQVVVPGHGPVGTAADLIACRRYVSDLLRLAGGLTAEAAAEAPIPAEYAGWAGPEVFGWNLEALCQRQSEA